MENLIRHILSQDSRIEVALLFGSHAAGKTTPMSDIDIGIITNVDLPLIEIGSLISQLEAELNATVDLIVLNDLYKSNPQFAFNIVSSCRVVFCKNEETLVSFKRNTYLYYFDTEPLRTMVDVAFRKRLASGKFGKKNYVG